MSLPSRIMSKFEGLEDNVRDELLIGLIKIFQKIVPLLMLVLGMAIC